MISRRTHYADTAPRFSRKWWLDGIRNFALVAVVTVLIWVYADMEFTDTVEFHATVRLSTAKSKDMILQSEPDVAITFSARGNRSSLERLRGELSSRPQLVYDVPDDIDRGSSPIPVADILNATTSLTRLGISLVSAAPQAVHVQLDRLISVQLPVKFNYDETRYSLVSAPIIEPKEVTARITKTNWQAVMQASKDPTPPLKTRPIDLQNVEPEKETTVTAEVMPGLEVDSGTPLVPVEQLEPKSVSVKIRLAKRTEVATITVSVRILCPASWWADDGTFQGYTLVPKDPLEWRNRQIQITGPRQDIDRLRRPEDVQKYVQAYVVLTDEDKIPVESWLPPREVIVRFSDGIQTKVAGEKPTVTFKMVKRATSPTPP